ncbi:MAG: phage portal protein [Dehalococcoidia bacterium]
MNESHPITRTLDAQRIRRYAEHLAFYGGDQWPASLRRQNRRLVFNYAKAIVDKTASYVLSGLNFGVDPVDDTPEAAARARETERTLARVYEENQLDQLDFDNEVDASILGDGAYKVTWDAAARRVRITAPDVQGLFAWWCGDDVARVWRVASRYMLDAEAAHSMYGIAPPKGARTRAGAAQPAIEIVEVWTDGEFELWAGGARIERRENPYGFIPFVIYPNLREPKQFWGVSDLPAIKEPLRELNRALTQLSMILELSGNPIAVLENVTESTDIAVMPGAVWEIPERARAYLLDLLQGGGVKLHADYVEIIYRALHDLGEAPRTAFGDNRSGLSGVALNVELDPLLKNVQRKRLIRASAFKRRNEMVLRILEQHIEPRPAYAPYRSRIIWGSVLPLDRSRLVADERALVASGIHSRRRAADELGVEDPESEFRRWLDEQRMLGG